MLTDSYGRVATDLRVSLTDRCNLRCSYCMPPEGLDWLPAPEVLTGDEWCGWCRIGVETLGIREVRFTGGEPLLRRDLGRRSSRRRPSLAPRPEISLTTNGIGLDRRAGALRDGGPRPDQRLTRHAPPRGLPEADPPRPARRRAVRPRGRRVGRAHPGQGQRGADARPERRRGTRACCATAWSTATSCGSSSRCRSTRSTAGSGRRWSPRARSSTRCPPRSSFPTIPNESVALPPPRPSSSTAGRPGSG